MPTPQFHVVLRAGNSLTRCFFLAIALFGLVLKASAQTVPPDYTNALWNPASSGHWYTTGYGHNFCVIHDMEGYYESTISFFQLSGTQASIHYCVNSLSNGTDRSHGHVENNPNDAPAGEITQMVRESYWAWHVLCWNRYMFGTEHEGFVNSPAWYTEAMYQASAGLQAHLCNSSDPNTPPIPMDRHHIIGHNEWQTTSWTDWMTTNWPQIDPTCNNHTDPGQFWNWSHFMKLVCAPNILQQPANQTATQGGLVTFSLNVTNVGTNNPTTYQWLKESNPIPDATNASLSLLDVQFADAGLYAVFMSNAYSTVTSSNAVLTVTPGISNLVAQPRPNSVVISWTTGTPGDSAVDFGLTTNYELGYQYNPAMVTNHAILLTGLQTNQTYFFRVTSYFEEISEADATGNFSTSLNVILQSSQASYLGVWVNDSSAANRYSPIYKYASVAPAAPPASATFRPTIKTPAQYDVYLWYSEGNNRSQIAPVTASFQGGAVSPTVNESVNGGRWQLIAGNQTFAAGTNAFVRLGNSTGESNKIVIADAVQWVYSPGQDLPVNGKLPAWWTSLYFGTNNVDTSARAANGYSILQDYILGIAPDDASTTLSLNLAPAKTGFQATFSPWAGGRNYQLQWTTNLAHPVWQTLTNLPVTTDGFGDGMITTTNAPHVPTYYRLSVQLAP